MNQLHIDQEKCIGCANCYRSCFVDVYRWDEVKKRPIVAYPKDCVNCCFCLAECPSGAITLHTDYSRDWEAIPGDQEPVTVDITSIQFRKERRQ